MQTKITNKKHIIFNLSEARIKVLAKGKVLIIPLILAGILFAVGFALADSCPSMTTVSGTSVNFVGEITDMGGDSTVKGWFEYGQSQGYGQTTSQATLSQTGPYCIMAYNLNPCTTYHYRAVAQNSAGTAYGDDKTFTTTCGQSSVDLKVNGSDGPISVAYNSAVTLSWTSNNVNSCQASGDWTGYKAVSGSQPVYNITSSKTFTINCTGPSTSASDSVTVNVSSPSLSVSLSPSVSSGCAPVNNVDLTASVLGNTSGSITYYFDCTNDGTWEKIYTTNANSYTAYDLCNFGSVGNFAAKVRVENQSAVAEDTENINVLSCSSAPTVDLKANGYDGSVIIPYNTAATLSWTSNNANYCTASGNWSGNKAISGSESTGNLTYSKSYVLTCTGAGGSNSDSVTVNVSSAPNFTVNKLVRNLSDGTSFLESVSADPTEVLSFSISVTAGNSMDNVIVRDILPSQIIWRSNSLKLDGASVSGDIISGYNIGSLSANQTRIIAFDADIASAVSFAFGNTSLVNSVTVTSGSTSGSDIATIIVTRAAVAGATTVPTGLTNNLFVDSFLIPLAIALLLVWLFRSRLIKWEQWLDAKRKGYREYKSDKVLRLKTRRIRVQEFLNRKIV